MSLRSLLFFESNIGFEQKKQFTKNKTEQMEEGKVGRKKTQRTKRKLKIQEFYEK